MQNSIITSVIINLYIKYISWIYPLAHPNPRDLLMLATLVLVRMNARIHSKVNHNSITKISINFSSRRMTTPISPKRNNIWKESTKWEWIRWSRGTRWRSAESRKHSSSKRWSISRKFSISKDKSRNFLLWIETAKVKIQNSIVVYARTAKSLNLWKICCKP